MPIKNSLRKIIMTSAVALSPNLLGGCTSGMVDLIRADLQQSQPRRVTDEAGNEYVDLGFGMRQAVGKSPPQMRISKTFGYHKIFNFPTTGQISYATTCKSCFDANGNEVIDFDDRREVDYTDHFSIREEQQLIWSVPNPGLRNMGIVILRIEPGGEKKVGEYWSSDCELGIGMRRLANGSNYSLGQHKAEFYFAGQKITEVNFILTE